MANRFLKRLFNDIYSTGILIKKQDTYQKVANGVLRRSQSQAPKIDKQEVAKCEKETEFDSRVGNYSSGDEDVGNGSHSNVKSGLELAWLSKALEPAFQFCRWALPTVDGAGSKIPPSGKSINEIIAAIQRSKLGIEGWSLSDLTIGLYLIYLHQASLNLSEEFSGVQISSEAIVHELMYHLELARGCYKGSAAGVARYSMLRENNVIKFVKDSSVMRPAYYIGIDPRKKLVILGIRGTQTVYDIITDIVSSSDEEVTFEGYSTHFGTAEAARWFLTHEMGTLRNFLEKHEGFRLRLVGHSLGGAIASMLAIMLRKRSAKELGFNPDIVSAVGIATPPCVSRDLAQSCSSFVSTLAMQDDIVPRLSAASIQRLRNEVLQTDWMTVIEKQDWRSVIGLVTNAKHVVSSVQDVARKLADYAKFPSKENSPAITVGKKSASIHALPSSSEPSAEVAISVKKEAATTPLPELFVPGALYYLKRNIDDTSDDRGLEYFTLWRRNQDEHFQRILLSANMISDHRCDSQLCALRDVIKGLPSSKDEDDAIFDK